MFPENFYYANKSIQYSHTPQGELDVQRLIQHQAPWKSFNSLKWEKKSLVFADWTMTLWSDKKKKAVINKLQELKADGFDLFISKKGLISPLIPDNHIFKNIETQYDLTLTLHQTIVKQSVLQLGLVCDQILILDDYQIEKLLNSTHPANIRTLHFSSFKHKEYVFPSNLEQMLHQATPPITTIFLEEYSQGAQMLMSNLQKKIMIPVHTHYKRAILHPAMWKELIKSKEITIQNSVFKIADLESLEVLLLCDIMAFPNELAYLLQRTPHLNKLMLFNRSSINNFPLDFVLPSHLECLQANNFIIHANTLQQLLTQTNTLKNIELNHFIISDELTKSLELSGLEGLTLVNGVISGSNLEKILTNVPSLREFTLNNIRLNNPLMSCPNFPSVDTMDLRRSVIDRDSVIHLIKNAPGLKYLYLRGSQQIEALNNIHFPLANIERLEIHFDKQLINFDIEPVLAKMPRLNSLYMNSLPDIERCVLPPTIKYLSLLNIKYTHTLWTSLLTHTKQLAYLVLHNCAELPIQAIPDLINVKELILSGGDAMALKEQDLLCILSKTPQLVLLSLYDFQMERTKELDAVLKNLHVVGNVFPSEENNDSLNKSSQPQRQDFIHTPLKSQWIDAQTQMNSNLHHHLQRLFFPLSSQKMPDLTTYRMDIYCTLKINPSACDIQHAFYLEKNSVLNLKPCMAISCDEDVISLEKSLYQENEANYYYGKQTLNLDNNWQPLASLSPREVLSHYHIHPRINVELAYSEQDNQYYIRSSSVQQVAIDFILKVPQTPQDLADLPPDIATLIRKLNQFNSNELVLDKEIYTGTDYLKAIMHQKTGACRHRAVVFKACVGTKFPEFPVRLITNNCHMFAEIKIKKDWIRCDLGGYPIQPTIDESNQPKKSLENLLENTPVCPVNDLVYAKHFETWNKETSTKHTIKGYCLDLVQTGDQNKRLLDLPSAKAVREMQLLVELHCRNTHRPIYVIHSAEELHCSLPFVQRIGNRGILREGPGGKLHEFLQRNKEKNLAPVVLVNYDNFSADDLIRFNGLLDDKPHADGTLLPENTLVIGLINTSKPDCYQGSDFYSRIGRIETVPFTAEELEAALNPLPIIEVESQVKTWPINLYHAVDWKERLLGRWVLKEDNLYFEEGELPRALKSQRPIEIQNGPWGNTEFVHFLQESISNGFIEETGERIEVPADITLIRKEGYDWAFLMQNISFEPGISQKAFVLNPTQLSQFFTQYQCDNQKQTLSTLPGILKAHEGNTLHVNLTRKLSEPNWAIFLQTAKTMNVQLICHVATGVPLLDSFGIHRITAQPPENWNKQRTSNTLVIESTERDTTLSQVTQQETDWCVFDVSECDATHLLKKIEGIFNAEQLTFKFNEREKALLTALDANQKVVLTGHFSEELVDSLTPLLIKRQSESSLGQLVIITEQTSLFTSETTHRHDVSVDEKKSALRQSFQEDEMTVLQESELKKESLSQLKARLIHYRIQQNQNTNDAWQGLHSLSLVKHTIAFDAEHSESKAKAFIEERCQGVHRVLQNAPFVYLSGLTAVGKSTFVEKYIPNANTCLYQGEARLLDWALDASNQRKILFIDEANIGSRQWSEFEGLFNNPPGILINGTYYPLTEQHKVIFAGNPLNYGGERMLAPLFARHGNAYVFEAMPPEFIYEEILKPVFEKTTLQEHSLNIAKALLPVYQFLVDASETEVLITARELQMMVLTILACHEENPLMPIDGITSHYRYELAKDLVPAHKKASFDRAFKPVIPAIKRPSVEWIKPKGLDSFIMTESRQAIMQQISELFDLRQLKRKAQNDHQKYGGLGGFVLEGEPGVGKSELVTAALMSHQFKESTLSKKAEGENTFYRMPVSMQPDLKKKLLLRAFHEGAVVIVDEINSSPMMERLLNELLMGKTPEGQRPDKPGFLMIGTQNPVTMAGRRLPGNALARRLIKMTLCEYSPEEMEQILIAKSIEPEIAKKMVQGFTIKVEQAKKEHLSPAPNFRSLLKLANQYLHAKEVEEKMDEEPVALENSNPETRPGVSASPVSFFNHQSSEQTAEEESQSKVYFVKNGAKRRRCRPSNV